MVLSRSFLRKKRKSRSSFTKGTPEVPRVIFSKTNNYIIVQAVDDSKHKTICYLSTENIELDNVKSRKNKIASKVAGELFAQNLKEKNISKIVFDRNGNIYHGKVKEFCDSMRKLGIDF